MERILNVAQVPPELAGNNAAVVKRGADALGWSDDFIYRNAKGCVGSGVCAFGCPTNAKQHTGMTYVPAAWDAGATTYSEVRRAGIVVEGGRARGVVAHTRGGGRLRVECDTWSSPAAPSTHRCCCAATASAAASGQLGREPRDPPGHRRARAVRRGRSTCTSACRSRFYIDEFADEGIMFEGAAGPPDYLAMSMPFSRERHRELMLRFRNLAQFGVMVSDLSRGSVRERLGRVEIRYDLCKEDVETVARGIELLERLFLEAGATEVFKPVEDGGPVRASSLSLMAFHPLGTARADASPERRSAGRRPARCTASRASTCPTRARCRARWA